MAPIKTLLLLHRGLSGEKLLPSAVWAAFLCHWVVKPVSWSQKHWIGRCASSRYIYMFMISEWWPQCTCNFFRRPQPDVAAKVWICSEMLIGESNIPRLADLAKLSNRVICAQQLLRWSLHYISTGHANILQQVSNNTKLAWTPARYYNSLGAWLASPWWIWSAAPASVRVCTIEAKVLFLHQHYLVVNIICSM